MPETAHAEIRSGMQRAVYYQACAEPFDDEYEQKCAKFRFGDRSVPKFGKRRRVRIVLNKNRQAQFFLQHFLKRNVLPFQVWRDLYRTGLSVDKPGNAYAGTGKTNARKFFLDELICFVGDLF